MSSNLHKQVRYTEGGYITLLAVVVASAIAATFLTTHLLQGVTATQTVSFLTNTYQAETTADACAELALEEIRQDTAFSGSASVSMGSGECRYTVVDTGGQSRRIEAEGAIADALQKVEVVITNINPEIEVQTWRFVSSF